MRVNPVHKHWAYVVGEFEAAINKQNAVLDAQEAEGLGVSDYETGKMKVLTDGLQAARSKKKASRFDFFKQPARNKHRALIAFLHDQVKDIYGNDTISAETKAGMIDMLRNWAIEEKGRITYSD